MTSAVSVFNRSDGWRVEDVAAILSRCNLQPTDIVYDPFMGTGSTLVGARDLGCRAVGCDANPLRVVVARVNALPPTTTEIDRADALLQARGAAGVMKEAASAEVPIRGLLQFLAVAGATSTGWLEGHIVEEGQLDAAMRDAVRLLRRPRPPVPAGHAPMLFCEDAFRPSTGRLTALQGRTTMVASPPFFGTVENPREAQLAHALGLNAPAYPTSRCLVPAYDSFLHSVADHCAAHATRVALEMGQGRSPEGAPNWTERLGILLVQRGFVLEGAFPSPGAPEPASIIVASRA